MSFDTHVSILFRFCLLLSVPLLCLRRVVEMFSLPNHLAETAAHSSARCVRPLVWSTRCCGDCNLRWLLGWFIHCLAHQLAASAALPHSQSRPLPHSATPAVRSARPAAQPPWSRRPPRMLAVSRTPTRRREERKDWRTSEERNSRWNSAMRYEQRAAAAAAAVPRPPRRPPLSSATALVHASRLAC